MGYVEAKTLNDAKKKVSKAIKRYNKKTNFPNRSIDYVEKVKGKNGMYVYGTRERKTRKDYKGRKI